jgi:protein-disulfide isomerase
MTDDWKLILKVVLGSAVLIMVVIFGLSKMAGSSTTLTVDQTMLLQGATLVKENGETKVTVVNFSDMECPACKRAHELLVSLNSTPGVKIVFRHFPLGIHKNAPITARAVETARQMGKGWEMIDLLFSKQEEWSAEAKIEDKLTEYAKSLGLDEKVFKEKLNSAEVAAAVQQDINLGDSLKLSGTPTIYVNGEQVAADFVAAKVTELLKTK